MQSREEILALFRQYDDPLLWEYPEGFDYQAAVSRFRDFAAALDAETGTRHMVETGSLIQDASFHSQIDLGSGRLRFSNFGDMVCLTPDHEVREEKLSVICRLCREKGYVFIPTEAAEQPYTGRNPGVTGIRDWWTRFFDWV